MWYYNIVFLTGAQAKSTKTELKGQRKCLTSKLKYRCKISLDKIS